MTDVMQCTLTAVCGYLAGSIPFGLILTKRQGIDVRQVGSGNIGATNVARAAGKQLAVIVLICDFLKGALPVLVVRLLFPNQPLQSYAVGCVMLSAVLGHVFPIWLKGRGGKGVATGLGVFVAATPFAGVCGLAAYALVFLLFRISSLGSLVSIGAIVLAQLTTDTPTQVRVASIGIALLIAVRHRDNIVRLWRGQEKPTVFKTTDNGA